MPVDVTVRKISHQVEGAEEEKLKLFEIEEQMKNTDISRSFDKYKDNDAENSIVLGYDTTERTTITSTPYHHLLKQALDIKISLSDSETHD